ncbi:hypothetical protein CN212_16645 [Sinorhizobium meliloti]|nr:hypothetical protein CN238_12310 [Sinorhizobium meliloti]RVG70795.1 hypothetical protein CN220_14755 [Sinorhizobium meliloti]RVH33953.1 hypothetical protein CN214_06270 [Sinorhizobium meliloti]RVH48943.1 hypothetical protein CN212_16645 [Sinorhizobium meliloti]
MGRRSPAQNDPRAFPLFSESRKRSSPLFCRNSGRKTAAHFYWNCSTPSEDHKALQYLPA